MEPTSNPTPTPNPMPGPNPVPMPTPAPAPEPAPAPVPEPTPVPAPESPAPEPTPAPTAPVSPEPVQGVAAANTATGEPLIQPPVNPVVRPTGMGVTDPIMMPEKPAEPDPVEEELKAPMKAAAPVPGSIGSAVSGPADATAATANVPTENPFADATAKPTPSVSFTDPAAQPDEAAKQEKPAKKNNKTTLIALIGVAVVIVIVLIVVLVMQLTAGSSSNTASTSNSTSYVEVDEEDYADEGTSSNGGTSVDDETEESGEVVAGASIVCAATLNNSDGTAELREMDFEIEDNQLIGATLDVTLFDADGVEASSASTKMEYEDLVGKEAAEKDDTYLDDNGTLLVSVDEFKTKLEDSLNVNGVMKFTCRLI